jgi:hypothetical protein
MHVDIGAKSVTRVRRRHGFESAGSTAGGHGDGASSGDRDGDAAIERSVDGHAQGTAILRQAVIDAIQA